MTMQTLTPIVLQELIDKIEVFPIEGTGKNRTQMLVIHYRFVGYVEIPEVSRRQHIKADTRKGVAVEYLTELLPAEQKSRLPACSYIKPYHNRKIEYS